MAIWTRLARIVKADLHGMMDRLEDPELSLRQSLREMEEELDRKEIRAAKMNVDLNEMRKGLHQIDQGIQGLDQDLRASVARDRDDLARALIRKRLEAVRHREILARQVKDLEMDLARFNQVISDQHLEYERLRLQSLAFCRDHQPRPGAQVDLNPTLHESEVEIELLRLKETIQGEKRHDLG